VPVANPAITRDKLNRLTSVAGQAMNIAVEANEKAQLATLTDKDVPIPVILKNIGSSDFAAVPEAMPIGEAAARAAAASLARYSLSPEAYARWRAGLRELAEAPAPKIDEVRLSGLEVTNSEVMKSFVQVQPGDTFSHEASDADATRLVARGDFTVVSPQVDREGDKTVLTYRAAEKPWGPDYLQFDLNLSTNLRGDTGWGIRVDYQKRWLNRLGGEIRVTGQVGRPNAFGVEYYQPIDLAQRYFVSPTVSITQTLGYVYSGDTAVTQLDQTRAAAGLDLGSAFGSWGEARLGLSTGYGRARTTVDVPWLPDQDKHRTSEASLRFYVDTLDQALFPSSGVVASGIVARSLAGLGAEDDYQRAALNARAYYSVGANVWSVSFRGGTDFGGNLPAYIQFRAGGLFNLSGYRQNELTGQSYAVGTVQLRRRIGWLDRTLGSAAWAGTSLELGNVFERTDGTSAQGALAAGSVYLGVSSRLGPIYFGYGLSEGGRYSWYLYLGSSLEQF
jgi:NTE family protein